MAVDLVEKQLMHTTSLLQVLTYDEAVNCGFELNACNWHSSSEAAALNNASHKNAVLK